MKYRVIERQTIEVAYVVEADSEPQARDLVKAMGCSEYDEIIETIGADIIAVEQV